MPDFCDGAGGPPVSGVAGELAEAHPEPWGSGRRHGNERIRLVPIAVR